MDAPEVLRTSARYPLPDSDPDLADLRSWASTLLADLSEDVLLDVQLVCTELASNAYEHAAAPRVVRMSRTNEVIRVEVEDGTPAELPQLGESRIADSRGRGLVLVAHLSRCWGTREAADGKTVWAEISV
ncbi:ATP-binding protein [Lentzea sp. NPDC042327]|uniref:ATP-binding protein n=1 Tax=Lentzea sp. NPDC042327 TaxID=3154801 RepID=UPI0033CF8F65